MHLPLPQVTVDLWLQGVADHVLPLAHTSFTNWALRSATPLAGRS